VAVAIFNHVHCISSEADQFFMLQSSSDAPEGGSEDQVGKRLLLGGDGLQKWPKDGRHLAK
jgi:hypothetical protein